MAERRNADRLWQRRWGVAVCRLTQWLRRSGTRKHRRVLRVAALAVAIGLRVAVGRTVAVPEDFPRFHVPGQESRMALLREWFWLHYRGAEPKSTLWDEWLSGPALWPAVETEGWSDRMRTAWRAALSGRVLDAEGYVGTHQHDSIAHPLGWPFPFWTQGQRSFGWHFSFKDTVGLPWRPERLDRPEGWMLEGARDAGLEEDGWALELERPAAHLTAPARAAEAREAPFLQLRWRGQGLSDAQPYVEWTTPRQREFGSERRMYFDPPGCGDLTHTVIPMYRHPAWTGEIAQIRVGFGNRAPARVVLQALFAQYDTRHNVNAQAWIRGAARYFAWTRDLGFLRAQLPRLRLALRYVMTEHETAERQFVVTRWVGHEGRSGVRPGPSGRKEIRAGEGIGNNYWDLLPFGGWDCYATVQYYDAVRTLAELERAALAHPEWNLPRGPLALDPAWLERHAEAVRTTANRIFWNGRTRRFNACIDLDGQPRDYGYTFLNLEAVHYGLATAERAREIMDWITGRRLVEGDTSQGADLYFWRFAPRASTRRNLDWYVWAWNAPESIPWGDQVQDGGAVLGFAYYDLMARLKVLGPDNAWERLQQMLDWFAEVQAAGGYRAYYDGQSRPGRLQGGGTPGGLGMDHEFFESVLVPQVMLDGFLGFRPRGDGFDLQPRLPRDWPELTLDRIRLHGLTLRVTVATNRIEIATQGRAEEPLRLRLPEGAWRAAWYDEAGRPLSGHPPAEELGGGLWRVAWPERGVLQFRLGAESEVPAPP